MNKSIQTVINHVNASLNNQTCDDVILDEELFYMITNENGLSALVYHSINKNNISTKLYNALLKDFYAYVSKDSLQLELIDKLKEVFKLNNINYVFLKGSHLKVIYPNSYLRGMGDIDVLVLKGDLKLIHKLFKTENIKLVSRSPQHDVFKTLGGLDIEIHPGFNDLKNKNFESFLNKAFNYISNNKMDLTYEFVYLNYHLAKHFYSGGIGIRSVLDIGIFISKYIDQLDEQQLISFASESNSLEFIKTILKLNERLFKIKSKFNFMDEFVLNDELFNQLVLYITKSGIHGWGREFNPFTARVIKEDEGKFKLIMSRIFPKYKEMKKIYPIVGKIPLLLPIFWFVRLFKSIIINGRSNIKKIKDINKVDNIDETKELLKKIGL